MKRVLIKVSGEMLNGGTTSLYDEAALVSLTKTLLGLQKRGYNIALVMGGGNIRRSRDTAGLKIERVVSDYLGMTGTIMNAVVLAQTIQRLGGKAEVFAPQQTQIPNATLPYEAKQARASLDVGNIVLCAGGIFLPYSTTDSTAVQRGLELECDMVVKATKVDGVYDKDPVSHDDAVKFDTISYDEALRLQLDIMDPHALALARKQDMVLYICHMDMLDLLGTNDMKGTQVHV